MQPSEIDLAALRKLHAAATPGEWKYDGMHNEIQTPHGESFWLIVSECRSAPDQDFPDELGHGLDNNFACIAALHNNFPALADRIEYLENPSGLLAIIHRLDPENLCDVFDDFGIEDHLQKWLAARDERMRREGAADWLEKNNERMDTMNRVDVEEEAARLRSGDAS